MTDRVRPSTSSAALRAWLAPLGVLVFAAPCLAAGCSPLRGAPAGSQCASAIDCAAGLACIPAGAKSICTGDAGSIESQLDAGHYVPPPDTGTPATHDAASDVADATKQDGVSPPPASDASPDVVAPATDAAHPSPDSAAPPVDSGHGAG